MIQMAREGEEVHEISYLMVTRRPVSADAVSRGAVDVVAVRSRKVRRRRVEEGAALLGGCGAVGMRKLRRRLLDRDGEGTELVRLG